MSPASSTRSFLARARTEAARHGADPWVFVRELLQNARDAGARHVVLNVDEAPTGSRISCRDDGSGMTFDHAGRYLFRLYASSKERDGRQAGRFGVGFWSVLLIEPGRLLIRSWPPKGPAWEVEIDGELSHALRRPAPTRRGTGTEITIELPAQRSDGQLAQRVTDAAWQSARFLTRRDDPRRPLEILVNGRAANAAFELPPPSIAFSGRGERGTVGLGAAPRIELFSKGLRLRAAVSLDDLLQPLGPIAAHTRLRFDELTRGVAPVALLESDRLEPLLARADARETRALRRLVDRARHGLRRLLEHQIEAAHPRSLWRRLGDALREAVGGRALVWILAAVVVAGLAAMGTWWGTRPSTRAVRPAPRRAPPPQARVLRDLSATYAGPGVDASAGIQFLALRYSPASAAPLFATLVVPDPDGTVPARPAPPELRPYVPPTCSGRPLSVELLAAGMGPLRLPVPSGHRMEPSSVLVGGRSTTLFASPLDEPVVILPAESGTQPIRYRSCPAASPVAAPLAPLPEGSPLAPVASALAREPRPARPAAALRWLSGRVRYSTAPAVASRHRALQARGQTLAERTLVIGAGDCDVLNGVLAQLLLASGVPARLVVGYVGQEGAAFGLHAWVEYRFATGEPWQILDASSSAATMAVEPGSAPSTPFPAPPTGEPVRPGHLLRGVASAAVCLILLAAWAGASRRRRMRIRRSRTVDLAPLLQGALERPEAFADSPAVFQRAILPTLRGRVSLAVAWQLASRSRLFVSNGGSPLARRAAHQGAVVLDSSQPEAAAVAESLGAVDLDEWDGLVRRSRSSRLLDATAASLHRLEPSLRIAGIPPRDRPSPGKPEVAPMILDLPVTSWLGRTRIERYVLLERDPWLASIEDLFARSPAAAVFTLADLLTERLGSDSRGQRLRAELAWHTMHEALTR